MRRRIVETCARPEFWIALLLVWVTASALRSLHGPWERAALTEWLRVAAGLGLALALGRWLRDPRMAARLLVAGLGAIAALGVADGLVPAHGGMVGPFRDHQLLGSALLVLLPLALGTALTAREASWKWAAQGVGMAGLVCLVMAQTRSAWFGAGAAGLTFAWVWWRRTRLEEGRRHARPLLVPLLLVVGVGLVAVAIIGTSDLQQPISTRVATLNALGQDGSWQARLRTWQGAERMAAARPLTGWGLGRYPGEQWAFTHVGRVLTPAQRPSLSEQAHNLYLQTTDETGLIGLALSLAILTSFVVRSLRTLRQAQGQPARSRDGHLAATVALVAGLTVDSFASPSYQFAEVSLFVWAALGVGLAALNRRETTEIAAQRLPLPLLRLGRLAASGALSLTLLSQFIPLGLLTPVEAYTATGYTYQASNPPVLTPVTITASPGQVVPFTLTAHYTNNADGNTKNVDVSKDSTTVFNATSSTNGSYSANFGASGQPKNYFVVPTNQNNGQPFANNSRLTISASFFDSASPVKRNAGNTSTVTIQVSPP